MELTKIGIAEAHICAAVRMFFADGHLVPVFTLANAAREIVENIGGQIDAETVQQELAAERDITVRQLIDPLIRKANFLKHADRDAAATIEIAEDDVVSTLRLACHDFGRIAGGMPIEAQVFEAWVYALAYPKVSEAPLSKQKLIRTAIAHFPGLRKADSAGRKKIGLTALQLALTNPGLRMEFKRAVDLPAKTAKA
jgi:hypothetical protein